MIVFSRRVHQQVIGAGYDYRSTAIRPRYTTVRQPTLPSSCCTAAQINKQVSVTAASG